jgi:signal transduction histidine kinase
MGKLSFELLSGQNIVTIGMFAPEGISLAFALYFGKKVWPGIFLGQLVLAYVNDIPLIAASGIASINSLEAVIAVILFEKFIIDKELKTFRDIIALIFMIVFILQTFSSFSSNLILLSQQQITKETFFFSTFSWWFGNIIGQLLFTPFLLLLFTKYKEINLNEYLVYGAIFGLFVYILEVVLIITNPFLLMSITAPVITFVIAKKGIVYATFLNVILALVVSYCVYFGIGAFHINSKLDDTINYNLFILTHIAIIFVVGTLFEEKKKYEKRLKQIIKLEVEKNKEQQILMLQQNRLAQMGEIISMIAHQWRQPLNNLSLINQLLLSKYKKEKLDDEAIEYFRKNSKKQINLMSTTIDDFRDFFKEEKSKKEFCINDTIENILEITKAIYTRGGIQINFKSQDKYITTGYQNAFAQALLNIINNAKDALIDSPVSDKKIDIDLQKNNDTVIITIKDNAGGIAEDIIDKIFDPYFSTKKEKNGTGLGLYMSKMIIDKQGNAKIRVFNDNDGANFKIYLKGSIHAT